MRAAQVTRLDGPDAIEVSDVEEPTGDGVVVASSSKAWPSAPLASAAAGAWTRKPPVPRIADWPPAP